MPHEVSLAEKVALLKEARVFPDKPVRVETVETHFAWIFLSPRFVYKLKKPIRFGSVDFRPREARHAYCELEVTLNRRLGEATYLRVVPLTRTTDGIALDGHGETIDYLVEMRRLPDGATLGAASRSAAYADADLARVVGKLIAFYACTPRAPWDGSAYIEALNRFVAKHINDPIVAGGDDNGLPPGSVERIVALQYEFVDRNRDALAQRAAAGRVVDAHGDLRAEHVFLTEVPQIIDCLEFSVELRWLDSAEEICFLALDCDRLELRGVGERLLTLYRRMADDGVPDSLLDFYRSRRALARALLSAWRVAEDGPDVEPWRARARWYLTAAEESISSARGA